MAAASREGVQICPSDLSSRPSISMYVAVNTIPSDLALQCFDGPAAMCTSQSLYVSEYMLPHRQRNHMSVRIAIVWLVCRWSLNLAQRKPWIGGYR